MNVIRGSPSQKEVMPRCFLAKHISAVKTRDKWDQCHPATLNKTDISYRCDCQHGNETKRSIVGSIHAAQTVQLLLKPVGIGARPSLNLVLKSIASSELQGHECPVNVQQEEEEDVTLQQEQLQVELQDKAQHERRHFQPHLMAPGDGKK